jgi:hypothetical protein
MNNKDRAILYGLVIGDGHISCRQRLKDGKYPYTSSEIIIGHGLKQYDYIKHKAALLKSVLGGKEPKVSNTKHTLKATGKTYNGYRICKSGKYFRQMHKVLYPVDKKKVISRKALSFMDAHSLALWYMDDGSIMANKNKQGEVTSLSFRICTQCSEEEANILVEWLKGSFGIDAKSFKSKGKYDVGGATQATLSLVNTVQEYIIPSMSYKILPAMKFVFRKSAKHPNFRVDDDIVRALGKPKEVEE